MADTITLPSGVEVYEGRLLVLPGASTILPIGDLTPAEVQALRDDVASVLGMTSDDLADVDLTGVNTGMILVRRSGQWVPELPKTGLSRVTSNWNGNQVTDTTWLTVGPGLNVNTSLSTGARAHIDVLLGASGSEDVAARADHFHPPTLKGRRTVDKAGAVLGGGETPLIDYTVTGLVPTAHYDVDIVGRIECVNTNQSGRVRLRTQIGTNATENTSRGCSGGVWTEISTEGVQMFVTGVTSLRLQFWAEYVSGDPTALYTGSLTYRIDPRGGTNS